VSRKRKVTESKFIYNLYGVAIFLILATVIILVQSLPDWFTDSDSCTVSQSNTVRNIIETDIQVQGLWSLSGVPLENFDSKQLMTSISGTVIVASTGCNSVMAIDVKSGDINWTHLPAQPDRKYKYGDLHQPRNLTLDIVNDAVYVSATNEIRAISVDDGGIIWANISDNFERNAHSVVIDENGQVTVSARGIWYIDPQTGALSDTPIELPARAKPSIDLQAVEIVSQVDDYYPISNIVTTDKYILLLDELARLNILDRNLSEEVYTIQFAEPEKTELLYEPGAIGGSWIALEDNVLVIYFQDTDVMSAYQILEPRLESQ